MLTMPGLWSILKPDCIMAEAVSSSSFFFVELIQIYYCFYNMQHGVLTML